MRKTEQRTTIRRTVGKTISSYSITYRELLNLYVKECKLKNLAEETITGYTNAAKYFLKFAGEDLLCKDVTQELIDDYKISLIERLKPESVNSYIFKVSPVVKYGFRSGYIPYDIEFNHMIEQERFKDIYTTEELEILLKPPVSNSFAEYRNWAIVNFLLATGIRAKELREILIKDVDLEQGTVYLRHTKNRKPRVLPISSTLHKILFEYLKARNGADDEHLFCNQFGEQLHRTTLQLAITKYCKKRGVDKYSLHLFRHTFITLSVRKGISPLILKRITGHTTTRTLDGYYNAEITDLTNIIDTFNPLEDFKKRTIIRKKKF